MNKINPSLVPSFSKVQGVRSNETIGKTKELEKGNESKTFAELLADKNSTPLRFSSHATKRLESRGIDLSSDDLVKLQDAVSQAQSKGSRESLILSDKGAFVVSVENGTVITAVDKGSMKENIFTNIDSTIMI